MKRGVLLAGAALALSSTIVLAQSRPESLLPPGVGTPTPTPAPTPAATQAPAPSEPQAPAAPQGGEVVQPVPSAPALVDTSGVALSDIPSVAELEEMTVDELDDLLGLIPATLPDLRTEDDAPLLGVHRLVDRGVALFHELPRVGDGDDVVDGVRDHDRLLGVFHRQAEGVELPAADVEHVVRVDVR